MACEWQLALPGATARQVHKAGPTHRPQRSSGALTARTGQVESRDNSLVGRQQLSAVSRRLAQVYAWARRISVLQDNWSSHPPADVTATRCQLPRWAPVWLPPYAPWLPPIEQVWPWLRRDLLTGHRLADDCSPMTARSGGARSIPSSSNSPMERLLCSATSGWSATGT